MFEFFTAIYDAEVREAKRIGTYNEFGIIKPGCSSIELKCVRAEVQGGRMPPPLVPVGSSRPPWRRCLPAGAKHSIVPLR